MPNIFGFSSTSAPKLKIQAKSQTYPNFTTPVVIRKEYRHTIEFEHVFRFIAFIIAIGISIWCFSTPVEAIEAITTIDVNEQTTLIFNLVLIAVSSNDTGIIAQAGNMSPIEDIMTVIVRVFASLMLITCSGILAIPGLLTRVLVICSQIVASTFFIYAAVEDDGAILKSWFIILYLIFACGVPALYMILEAIRESRALLN